MQPDYFAWAFLSYVYIYIYVIYLYLPIIGRVVEYVLYCTYFVFLVMMMMMMWLFVVAKKINHWICMYVCTPYCMYVHMYVRYVIIVHTCKYGVGM